LHGKKKLISKTPQILILTHYSFKEAYEKFGDGPNSNKLIATHVGNGVHPNHISRFKKKWKKINGSDGPSLPKEEESETPCPPNK